MAVVVVSPVRTCSPGFRTSWKRCWPAIECVLVFSLCACAGEIASLTTPEENAGSKDKDAGSRVEPLCRHNPEQPVVGHTPMRRLTRLEYRYTIEDLLGLKTDVHQTFSEDDPNSGFFSNQAANISGDVLDQFSRAAADLAVQAMAGLRERYPCDRSAEGDEVCARNFIESFGADAYRRPLTSADIERYMGLFGEARADLSLNFEDSMRLLVETFLQSPNFLFRIEQVEPPEPGASIARLSSHSIASSLSYLLWRSIPDDALRRAAESGQLATLEGVAIEARRMLGDERAQRARLDFHRQWLRIAPRLEKNENTFPEFNSDLEAAMRAELSDFLRVDPLDLETLLTTTRTVVRPPLDSLYGVSVSADDEPAEVELSANERAGIYGKGNLSLSSVSDSLRPQRGEVSISPTDQSVPSVFRAV